MSQIYKDKLSGRFYTVKRRPMDQEEWLLHWMEPGQQPETWRPAGGFQAWRSRKAAEEDAKRTAKRLHWQAVQPDQIKRGDVLPWIPPDTPEWRCISTSCRR